MSAIHDPTMTDADAHAEPAQQRALVTLRLQASDGRIWDALAVDDRTMRAQVVQFEGLSFLFAGDDKRDGRWMRLFRQIDVVRIRSAR